MDDLWQRFRQRKIVQWAAAYVAAAFALLQGADILAQQFAWPEAVQRGISLALVLGFFVTLLLAWYHGERGVQKVSGTELLLLTLLLAIGGGLLWRYSSSSGPGTSDIPTAAPPQSAAAAMPGSSVAAEVGEKSIAVLPFASMGGGQDGMDFAEGLSEEVINSLSRVPDLQVAARTSSFAFRSTNKTIPEIAGELGVATVLEGSVRRSSDRLRITTQLVRAADGFELWSETYNRSNDDVIAIQEDVAQSIATALKTATDPEALKAMQRAGTRSVPAYQAYLQALAYMRGDEWRQGELGGGEERAQAALRHAISLDPKFVDAYARLAVLQLARLRPSAMGSPEADETYVGRLKVLRIDLERASSLARTPAEGHYYAALLASVDQQYVEAMRLMSDYLRAYPGDRRGLQYMSDWALYVGDRAAAVAWAEKATREPDVDGNVDVPVQQFVWAGDFKRAAALAREWLQAEPMMGISELYQVHRALLSDGDTAGAARLVPRIMDSKLPQASKDLVQMRQACAEGRVADAIAILAESSRRAGDISVQWNELILLGRNREADQLLARLDTPEFQNALSSYLVYPQFDVTRFPRLQAVLAAQGIQRPPARPPPFACRTEASAR